MLSMFLSSFMSKSTSVLLKIPFSDWLRFTILLQIVSSLVVYACSENGECWTGPIYQFWSIRWAVRVLLYRPFRWPLTKCFGQLLFRSSWHKINSVFVKYELFLLSCLDRGQFECGNRSKCLPFARSYTENWSRTGIQQIKKSHYNK